MAGECGKLWPSVTDTDHSLGQVTWRRGERNSGHVNCRLPVKKSMLDSSNTSINERRMFFTMFFMVCITA